MDEIRFCVGEMPPPEEIAEVERIKSQIREEHLLEAQARKCRFSGGNQWALTETDREQERKRLAMLEVLKPEPKPEPASSPQQRPIRPVSSGDCPTCGKAFGKIRRCFVCKPVNPPRGQAESDRFTAVPPTSVPRPIVERPKASSPLLDRPRPASIPSKPAVVADVVQELDAIRAVYETLRDLPEPSLIRVRRYLNEVLWPEPIAQNV